MATEKVILRDSVKAGEDLSKKQYFLIKLTEENTAVLAASGDLGYANISTPIKGQFCTYAVQGIAKVICGETIKEGQLVAANNKGEGQVAASGQKVVGQAREKGEEGQIIAVTLGVGAKA